MPSQSLVVQQPAAYHPVPSEHLFLNFQIQHGGRVEVFPSFHYLSLPTLKRGKPTPYLVELRDCHNQVLHSKRIELNDPYRDLDSAALDFYKPIPFDQSTAKVVFICDSGACTQKELRIVDVPSKPPRIRLTAPETSDRLTGKVRVAWEAQLDQMWLNVLCRRLGLKKAKSLSYLLRYSNDDGQSWRTITPRLQVTEYVVDLDQLPGGERCQFQVLGTEGIRTGMAVSDVFTVPRKPRVALIAAPASGTVVSLGEAVPLIGEVFSPEAGSAPPQDLQWSSNLEGSLGIGQEIRARDLRPGLHTISLRALDGFDGETVASIQVEVEAEVPVGLKHTSRTHPDHHSADHAAGQVSTHLYGDEHGN